MVTSAEGADADSLGQVDEIKQYPFSAFLRSNQRNNPLGRQGVPQLPLQRSFHPGRLRTRVSGLRQVHKAENRPRGPTHLGRLLTVQIHPAMAALWLPLMKYVLRSCLMSTADKRGIYLGEANMHRQISWQETRNHASTEIFILLSNKYICCKVMNKN